MVKLIGLCTYIRMLQKAQLFNATIHGADMYQTLQVLKASDAFEEGEDYILKIVKS
ncbi:hypothetical protein [Pedobacter aquatilis]|uniref:hypothetical protein n=1 Tax=Pedobacter aquatilis TaxID=351343 RepID=UPI0025B3E6F5|nr:hypothetical protein [Pedobacter aquatilis]